MSERTKPTPGPWSAHWNEAGQRFYIHAPGGRQVARVPNELAAATQNAQLIAAAPDLLEALEALMEFWDNGTPVQPGALVVDEARAALAKAQGEHQG